MNMTEYLAVKDFTYLEYCDYLQNKYGIGLDDYMTKSYNPKPKCKRTKEGLLAHHKKEDTMILLSTKDIAMTCPFEWQLKENIVYCDYLEHLLLHILICKYPSNEKVDIVKVGFGGVVNFIVPELNDLYSGWETNQAWRKNCHDKVKNDKDVYIKLLKQFIDNEKNDANFDISFLCKSFNEPFGFWSNIQNSKLYAEIKELVQAQAFEKKNITMKENNCTYKKGRVVSEWLTGDDECDAYSKEYECGGIYNKNYMDVLGNRTHDCFWDCSKCKYQKNEQK